MLMDVAERLERAYRDKRVLVTGGASFIGSHLTELLVRLGARIRVADDLSSGRREHLAAVAHDIEFLQLDLRDPRSSEVACAGREIVFHLAAAHGGRGYIESHPVECTNNMLLDHTVFAAAARQGVRQLVVASSACVYPTTLQASTQQRALLKETDCSFDTPGATSPDGEYGWAKLMGELQLRAFVRQYGLDGIACRLFTAYGERENETHAVVALIAKAICGLDPYPIWGDGSQTRNFTHVVDTATGMALAGACLRGFETINIGTDQHHTILDLVQEVLRTAGHRPREIKKELDRPVGVKSRAADIAKCRERLLWQPTIGLSEGIARTTEWYVRTYGNSRHQQLERLLMERA
jgi:nucleoside-diphosphate-sugar epimerase